MAMSHSMIGCWSTKSAGIGGSEAEKEGRRWGKLQKRNGAKKTRA